MYRTQLPETLVTRLRLTQRWRSRREAVSPCNIPSQQPLVRYWGLRSVTDELVGAGELAIKIQNINVGTRSARYNVRLVGKLAPYET